MKKDNNSDFRSQIRKQLIFLLVLSFIDICILISPCCAASSSRCAILTIYAQGDGYSSSLNGNYGHVWLTIQNSSSNNWKFLSYTVKPGEMISISKWQDGGIGKGGVYINREQIKCIGNKPTSYSIVITREQLKKIEENTPDESFYDVFNGNWALM